MRVPPFLLVHRIRVEPLTGQGAAGPVYGPPVEVRCLLSEKRQRTRDRDGVVHTTSGLGLADLDAETVLVVGSRVTDHNGRATWLVTVDANRASSLPGARPLPVPESCTFTLA